METKVNVPLAEVPQRASFSVGMGVTGRVPLFSHLSEPSKQNQQRPGPPKPGSRLLWSNVRFSRALMSQWPCLARRRCPPAGPGKECCRRRTDGGGVPYAPQKGSGRLCRGSPSPFPTLTHSMFHVPANCGPSPSHAARCPPSPSPFTEPMLAMYTQRLTPGISE